MRKSPSAFAYLYEYFTQTLTTFDLEKYGMDAEEAERFANGLVQNKVILLFHHFDYSSTVHPLLFTGAEKTPTWRK